MQANKVHQSCYSDLQKYFSLHELMSYQNTCQYSAENKDKICKNNTFVSFVLSYEHYSYYFEVEIQIGSYCFPYENKLIVLYHS